MLYSIIPPVLIVLSLVGIIIFLMKKSSKLALLEDGRQDKFLDKSSTGKIAGEKKVNKKFLLFLEKITRRFKLIFLKLENIFSAWGESIKQKRKMKENEGKFSSLKREVKEKEKKGEEAERDKVFFRRTDGGKEIITGSSSGQKNRDEMIEAFFEKREEESKKSLEKKDLFEKILIERIAANPKDVEAYERLGEYYFEIENWNYSKECFKQVIKLSPQNKNVKIKMRKLERLLSR